MIYYRHFGLSGAPFQFTPSPRMLFLGRSHSEGLAALEGALKHPAAGLTLVLGEAGSGKTTLAVVMLARECERSRAVYLANPKVGCGAMMREIMRQLGIAEHGSHHEMIKAFSRHVAGMKEGGGVLVLVDEAHNLSDASLEQLGSLFSERGGGDRIHIALMGQPELLARLATPKLRQVNDFTCARVVLKPLSKDEAARYVDYRLTAYDGSVRSIFAPRALDHLLEHARGAPRRINVLCHNAMLIAHGSNASQVSLATARAAVKEFEHRVADLPRPAPKAIEAARPRPPGDLDQHDLAAKRTSMTPARSRLCMGMSLLAFSVAISALYVANYRPPEMTQGGMADAEDPAIFGDALNGESWSGGPYQMAQGGAPEVNSDAVQPLRPITGIDPAFRNLHGGEMGTDGAAKIKLHSQIAEHVRDVSGQRAATAIGFGGS